MKKNTLYILLSFIFFLFNANRELRAQSPTNFITSGTFVVPAGVTSVQVEVYGGGGGGGYGGGSNKDGGGGGGGGGYAILSVTGLTCGTSHTITVGAGGAGGVASTTNATAGGTSSAFGISASGGGFGVSGAGGAGGTGGAGTGGSTNSIGGAGGAGVAGTNSGGGGGAAGTTGAGTAGSGATAGAGGGGMAGAGGAGSIANTAVGVAGNVYGGGGGGGTKGSNGGAGAGGYVRITYTCPAAPAPNAGTDITTACVTTTTLAGSAIPTCMTGLWTVVSGTATITTPTSPTSGVTGLVAGTNVTLRWTVTNPGCNSGSDDIIITTPLLPTITLTSAAGTNNQSVCSGAAMINITYFVGGSATGASVVWSPAGTPAGLTVATGTTTTISGTPTVAGTYNYTVTTTGGSCGSVSATGTVTVRVCNTSITNETVTTCGLTWMDSGGPGGPYLVNQNYTKTFCSATAGQCVSLAFTSFSLEANATCLYDWMQFYDGNSTAAPTLGGKYCGTNSPGTISPTLANTSGCITVTFRSDGSVTAPGWVANITCVPCATTSSCTDGIQNGTETGIDCGGTCMPCHCTNGILDGNETSIDTGGSCGSCFDGIMNGTETGVDCGGSCALVCTTNNANPDGSSNCGACPATVAAVVYPTVCPQVGTSAYNLNSPNVNFTSCGVVTAPVPTPTCAVATGALGTWIKVDLAPGVTQVQLAFNSGSVANGNNNTFAAAYQGTGCGALTAVPGGCQNSVFFVSGVQYVNQVFFTGLNPNQDLWIFMFNDNGKTFNLNYSLIGTTGPPANTTCATASPAIGSACNLGASGATFTTPGSAGVSCTGGNWGSNENTTFNSFTATATTASLQIGGITCNSGTSGSAQFAVWTSCAAVGTYGAGFLGCAVGTGTINLTSLTPGQTYYIASDGFAGDNCKWNFSGTNIALPIELLSFNAIYENDAVLLKWATASEKNNDYFTVERTIDGVDFEFVATVKGAGNSTSILNYDAVDVRPYNGLSYYRLKQTDFDGKFEYSELVAIRNNNETFIVYPNPAGNNIEISFNTNNTEEAVLNIRDLTGRLVLSQQVSPHKGMNIVKFDTSNYSKGIYFVTLTNKFEELKTKFIKE